ncbi:MAG TPA: SRPBCC domain-containing protein [Pseudonocardiaceae bacterium]|nr:SRPBCC domain-containing protein [Pseudonocardiaceae bacterium]
MQLEHQFTVPASPEVVWAAVVDPARVAPCMPGATLTEVNGSEFAGSVKVKLGPVSLLYKGSGQFVEIDEQSRRVVIKAAGKDSRGNGTASATVTVTLRADGEQTHGTVVTDLAITGKPAQFGRGMIAEVGGKILDTFATCLAGKLGDPAQAGTESAQAATPAKPAARKRAASSTRATAATKATPAKPAVRASTAKPAAAAKSEATSSEAKPDDKAQEAAPAETPATDTAAKPAASTPAKPAASTPAKPAVKATPAKSSTPAKPAAAKAAPAKPAAAAKPAEPAAKPAAAKPAEPAAKPSVTKPPVTKPAVTKPAVTKPVVAKPVEPAAVPATNGAVTSLGVRPDEENRTTRLRVVESETEPIDLLDYAGPSVLKRAVPALAGIVLLLLLIRWLRRR